MIQEHSCSIKHIPGGRHIVPDALSRSQNHEKNALFKQLNLIEFDKVSLIQLNYKEDNLGSDIIKCLNNKLDSDNPKVQRQIQSYDFTQDLLFWIGSNESKLCIPGLTELTR